MALSEPVDFITALHQRYRRTLARYFEKHIGRDHDVDDLVQEVFMRLAFRRSVDDVLHVEGFVFQIATNVLRDRIRRQNVRHAAKHDPLDNCVLPANDFSPERVLQGRELLEHAIEAMRELPVRTRTIFMLRLYEELKLEEIAVRLGLSIEGVRFHLRRAKTHIATRLRQDI